MADVNFVMIGPAAAWWFSTSPQMFQRRTLLQSRGQEIPEVGEG